MFNNTGSSSNSSNRHFDEDGVNLTPEEETFISDGIIDDEAEEGDSVLLGEEPSSIESVGESSTAEASSSTLKSANSWIIHGKWGKREGKKIECLYPGCGKKLYGKDGHTTTLKNHLQRKHNVTGGVNDGKCKPGPLEEMFQGVKQPRAFNREEFMDHLLRFLCSSTTSKVLQIHIRSDFQVQIQ
ncbi:hypothetical protein BJV82DRAFT_584452 [Fennellomyces sp. T-0311]|nr:hypothetical protein BJV82DRAFT_584452 [Fennellomyces sp. T-0311]